MKKKIMLLVCSLIIGLMGCGSNTQAGTETTVNEPEVVEIDAETDAADAENTIDSEDTSDDETADAEAPAEGSEEVTADDGVADTDLITEDQALAAIKKYWFEKEPELEDMLDSDEYTIYFEVTTNDEGEIVVLYRSYTAAETRYYIDPETGNANITELVPGIFDEETASNEKLNIRDYMD
ncbi:MAG: hypothetical protein K6F90_03645 [Lachnospiraceae bacterium]|nr:hypothetical protein [Lachnospiraceae bacterium]